MTDLPVHSPTADGNYPEQKPLTVGKKIRRLVGKAIYDYDMISASDKIAVGLSGGKDSVLLLITLKMIQRWSPIAYEMVACSVDMTGGGWDTAPMKELCQKLQVPYHVVTQPIEQIIRSRDERSPCSFCANMRRGILNSYARSLGCNKLALGHNLDDTVETTLMNLLRGGRFRCYQPKLWQDKSDIWIIRPLIYLTEHQIRAEIQRLGLPLLDYVCPFSAETERSRTKKLVELLGSQIPDVKSAVLHALENIDSSERWKKIPSFARFPNAGRHRSDRELRELLERESQRC